MASTKAYLDFVLEQLSGLDEISSRAMMGAFILYYRGKVFGGIYDDRLLVKPVPVVVKMMPDAKMEQPYDGAKKMILVDNVDNRQFLCELVESMWEELPKKKEKKLRKKCKYDLTKTNKYSIINNGDLYQKAENTNVQMELKPLWFGLFLIFVENLRTTISKKSIIIW